jgi:hypothetical protein
MNHTKKHSGHGFDFIGKLAYSYFVRKLPVDPRQVFDTWSILDPSIAV